MIDFCWDLIKLNVLVMGEMKSLNMVCYIYGEMGQGIWIFYGGYDLEDYEYWVSDLFMDLNLYLNLLGYWLILNNIFFLVVKKKLCKIQFFQCFIGFVDFLVFL